MRKKKQSQSLRNLGAALERLREALQEPETNSLAVDGTIQRFEFVIELFWKTLKRRRRYSDWNAKGSHAAGIRSQLAGR